jgi:hypothetical protein
MAGISYRFLQRVFDESGAECLVRAIADFRPLAEDVAFSGILEGRLRNDGAWGAAAPEPVWEEGKLTRIAITRQDYRKSYGLGVLSDHAVAALLAARLLTGDEDPGDTRRFTWQVEVERPRAPAPSGRWQGGLKYAPFPASGRRFADLGIEPQPGECQVWIAAALLEELRESARNHLACERADFLLGHLIVEDGAAAVAFSSRIPATGETGSSATHFGFSPESFARARAEHERRYDGLAILGWAHNHPPPCGADCLMRVPPCDNANVFFSVHDRGVHRQCFSAPFTAGLVAGKAAGRRADEPEVRAFGWKDGVIVAKELNVY